MKNLFFLFFFAFIAVFAREPFALAQEIHQDLEAIWKARVVGIVSEREEQIPGLEIRRKIQEMEISFLEGPLLGNKQVITNDYVSLSEGDTVYVNYLKTINGEEFYSVNEPDRSDTLSLLFLLFIGVVVFFGGKEGIRSLLALFFSFLFIFQFLFPALLSGKNPVAAGILFAILVLGIAIFSTHGMNKKSLAAFLGSLGTIILAFALAQFAVSSARLSGFAEEESIYLNLDTGGAIDFQGLLLTAIIIGILGVLDDIAITQAAAVKELSEAAPHLNSRQIYVRALRIGREHVGALVNTLALAYTGTALPLLLLFYGSELPLPLMLNKEVFAAEIIRTITGSIAIILSVPITTAIAVWLLVGNKKERGPEEPSEPSHRHLAHRD